MKSTLKIVKNLLFLIIVQNYLFAQNEAQFTKTKEQIIIIELENFFRSNYLWYPIGRTGNNPIFLYKDLGTKQRDLYQFIEKDTQISKFPINHSYLLGQYRTSFNIFNSILFCSRYILDRPDEYGYSELFISNGKIVLSVDSIYNADKKIHSSFSSDGRYLLVNSLNTLSDYYNPEQDNRIMVYDLSEIDQGNIKKEYIPCDKCADSYLVNNTLFFTIGRKDAYGGFNNKDIYMAPWRHLEDTTKIASNTKIISISPDGKYILGSRFFDRQQNTCVIIEVASKKYQMLLGRDYYKNKSFYSHHENKFAFDFKGYLIYVDFPEKYPFDALNWRNEEIPDWTEKEFWSKYRHDPLPGRN